LLPTNLGLRPMASKRHVSDADLRFVGAVSGRKALMQTVGPMRARCVPERSAVPAAAAFPKLDCSSHAGGLFGSALQIVATRIVLPRNGIRRARIDA
jgi:hypothetical protein